ncbi:MULTISPECIES: hypothetical protein [unclassified Moorena]|uniref:hypothetical protein n=1 Tax=unclassified Moorena TaxID=2683338 RepID=UPI0013FF5830|nr:MULTISPECIES: hypothetical protein [unclassified Moorena]NEO17584.1 hypothetical protein [Moorena sp. SIO3E8]NEQ04130.1 hypothetical protein [Moorena sp. SIO3F7]NEQ63362.1 hypothetical protein [Moorena sp. SIO4A1]
MDSSTIRQNEFDRPLGFKRSFHPKGHNEMDINGSQAEVLPNCDVSQLEGNA